MIRIITTSAAAICLMTGTAFAAPTIMTEAQMAETVAGKAHQAMAADLGGPAVAELMPAHVAGDRAHQSGAADLKGAVADLMPDHVRMNP